MEKVYSVQFINNDNVEDETHLNAENNSELDELIDSLREVETCQKPS